MVGHTTEQRTLKSRSSVQLIDDMSQILDMGTIQALVIVPVAVACAVIYVLVFCSNAEAIAVSSSIYDIGRLYLLTLVLPFIAFSGLALGGVAVLIEALSKKVRGGTGADSSNG